MLIPNHPGDESLSSLASHDPEALADETLTSHVAACVRCTDLVNELGALRASLAELPDLEPSRPLRLLPPVDEPVTAGAGAGAWMRRLFAPVMTAGAALALVGVVGTTAPSLGGLASSPMGGGEDEGVFQGAGNDLEEAAASEAPAAPLESAGAEGDRGSVAEQPEASPESERITLDAYDNLPAERSPWPMVLFTGVAIIVGALLLRWILVPRGP